MTVQELFTKWGFKIDMKPLQQLETQIGSLTSKVNAIGIAATAAAGSIFGIAKFTADAGDAALKTSQQLGINIEEFQKLAFAAQMGGVETGEFAASLRILSRNLVAAKGGSKEAVESFKKVGLNASQFATADQAVKALADRFAKMPDGPEKTAAAMDLFGRSGSALIPVMKDGSKGLEELGLKAEAYGIVLTEAQAKAGEEFNDTLEEFLAVGKGLRNVLGNALIPQLTKMIRGFIDFSMANREVMAQNIGAFLSAIGKVVQIVVKAVMGAIEIFSKFGRALSGSTGILDRLNSALDYILGNDNFLKILGATTAAIYGMAVAFGALNASALLIPATIAAIIGLIALLIEDFIAFSEGEDSALGLLINYLKTEFPGAFAFVTGAVETAVNIFKIFWNVVSIALNGLKQLAMFIYDVLGLAFDWLGEKIQKAINFLNLGPAIDKIKSLFSSIGGGVSGFFSGAADLSGTLANEYGAFGGLQSSPESSPAIGGNSNSNAFDNKVNINVTVPPGSNANQVGQAVKDSVMDGMDTVLRSSKRTFEPGVAY